MVWTRKATVEFVYDLGGGIFDVSIIEIADLDGDQQIKMLIDQQCDTFLGGEDFDNALIEYLVEEFEKKQNLQLETRSIGITTSRAA